MANRSERSNPMTVKYSSGVLQFLSSNIYAASIAKNLPIMAIKLIKSRDFPLCLCGICSESNVLAIIKVMPKLMPEIIRFKRNVLNCVELTKR